MDQDDSGFSSINHQAHGIGSIINKINQEYTETSNTFTSEFSNEIIVQGGAITSAPTPVVDGFVPPVSRWSDTNEASGPYFADTFSNFAAVSFSVTTMQTKVYDFLDPTTVAQVGSVTYTNLEPGGQYYDAPYLYVAGGNAGYFAVVNLSDPTNPTIESEVQLDAGITNINGMEKFSNDRLVMATVGAGTIMVDVSDPTAPAELDRYTGHAFSPQECLPIGDGYIAVGLEPVDILSYDTGTESFSLYSQLDTGNQYNNFWATFPNYDDKIYGDAFGELHEIDVSDPANPVHNGIVYDFGGSIITVEQVGHYLYIENNNDLEIYDFTNINNVKQLIVKTPSISLISAISVEPDFDRIVITDGQNDSVESFGG